MATFIGSLAPSGKRGPVGECIYTTPSNPQHEGELTSEHIVAEGLGGRLELLDASCPGCCKITSEVERQCLRGPFQHARQLLKLGRLRKPKAYVLARTKTQPDETDWQEVKGSQYPLQLLLQVYERPGILVGRPPHTEFAVRAHQAFLHIPGGYGVGDTVWTRSDFGSYVFGRMLAKIAHAAAVAVVGRASFEPLLPEVIVGGNPFLSHFIGSPDGDVNPVLGIQHVREEANLHEVSIARAQNYLIAEVGLFARLGFHPYEVVVGRAR
jgi:hypothetical protein